jgi:hypothetical protein
MSKILTLQNSPRQNKRYRVYLKDGSYYDFGLKGAQTYIDHYSQIKRRNYWRRHMGNPREQYLINNLIPSPALYSAYILWGLHTDIQSNIDYLNGL